MRADRGLRELAVDAKRPPEEHDLRPSGSSRAADDDVAGAHRPTEASAIHGWTVKSVLGSKPIRSTLVPMPADSRTDRCETRAAGATARRPQGRSRPAIVGTVWSVGSTVSSAAVMLISASAGTTSRSAPRRLKPDGHAGVDTAQQHGAGKTAPLQIATAASSNGVRTFRRPNSAARGCASRPRSREDERC